MQFDQNKIHVLDNFLPENLQKEIIQQVCSANCWYFLTNINDNNTDKFVWSCDNDLDIDGGDHLTKEEITFFLKINLYENYSPVNSQLENLSIKINEYVKFKSNISYFLKNAELIETKINAILPLSLTEVHNDCQLNSQDINSRWSLVYYLNKTSGDLEFWKDYHISNTPDLVIQNKLNRAVFFPSCYWHRAGSPPAWPPRLSLYQSWKLN